MATPVLGTLTAFNPDVDTIKSYLERAELYFTANTVANAKKVPALLTAIGPSTYTLLSNLFAPDAPKDKSLAEITAALTTHFQPTRSVIAERFYFHRRNQTATETIAVPSRPSTGRTSLQIRCILGRSTTRQARWWSTNREYTEETTVRRRPHLDKSCQTSTRYGSRRA